MYINPHSINFQENIPTIVLAVILVATVTYKTLYEYEMSKNGIYTIKRIVINYLFLCVFCLLYTIIYVASGKSNLNLLGISFVVYTTIYILFYFNFLRMAYRIFVDIYNAYSPNRTQKSNNTIFWDMDTELNLDRTYLSIIILYLIYFLLAIVTTTLGGLVQSSITLNRIMSVSASINISNFLRPEFFGIIVFFSGIQLLYSNIIDSLSKRLSCTCLIIICFTILVLSSIVIICLNPDLGILFNSQIPCNYRLGVFSPLEPNVNGSKWPNESCWY